MLTLVIKRQLRFSAEMPEIVLGTVMTLIHHHIDHYVKKAEQKAIAEK